MSEFDYHIGYCTNVHAGADLERTRANLTRHALAVKRRCAPERPMGVGLWLSATAAAELRRSPQEFRDWLADVGLVPYTFNGFPYGDFHQAVVKHAVYEPTWWDERRLCYTLDLIECQHALLPTGLDGSISTLPIAWGSPPPGEESLRAAARQLLAVAERLGRLETEQGRWIRLAIEPEPGCVFDRAEQIVRFFEHYLLPGADERLVRRHLTVCHDVCHSAVMFEDQAAALEAYRVAGIAVGKVQVSAAVALPDDLPIAERAAAIAQLAAFDEPRYLHQTSLRGRGWIGFHQDLAPALAALRSASSDVEARVHFHVPIYLEHFGHLRTTQGEILRCLSSLAPDVRHFEVETYAWGVLPAELQRAGLAEGIADELVWFREQLAAR